MNIWWGTYDFPKDGAVSIQAGPLHLGVKNIRNEWQVYYEREEMWEDSAVEPGAETVDFVMNSDTLKERYVLQNTSPKIIFTPTLGDRPFVARPATPFYVPSGQSVVIFVSTPLWVKISAGDEPVELSEIAIIRPSDSWFGPNTIQGELCYDSKTNARLSVEELPKRYHRAITPIEIANKSESHLLLEKISLPVPYLELYEIAGTYLWTQGIRMTRKDEDKAALIEKLKGPPVQVADSAVHISGPRTPTMEGNIIKTISSSIFS